MPSVAFRAPSLILCFLVPRAQIVHNARSPCSLPEMLAPGACMCLLQKKNIDLLLFCDFVAEIYKKKKKETNGIKFKRCGFDKIDWNTWTLDLM